ncbi:MAG: DUF2129 domain-containing protein [bacterium]
MRTAIVVHYNNEAFLNDIDDRLFSVYYNSKRFKYVYLYLNKSNKDRALAFLNNTEYELQIEDSLLEVEEIII